MKGSWIPVVKKCIGYSQISATILCYLDPVGFAQLPDVPTLKLHGAEMHLVSYQTGKVRRTPGKAALRKFPSVLSSSLPKHGETLSLTIDAFTRPGSVQLVSKRSEDLMKDYNAIRELEAKNALFTVN